jgi:hypothetical protein
VKKQLAAWASRDASLRLRRCAALRLVGLPDEPEAAWTARLGFAAREARDAEIDALKAKMAARVEALGERERKLQARLDKEQAQAQTATVSSALSFGATVLGAIFGRKTFSAGNVRSATTAVRSAGRAIEQRGDVGRIEDEVAALRDERAGVERELEAELAAIAARNAPAALVVDELAVPAKKADIRVDRLALGWRQG